MRSDIDEALAAHSLITRRRVKRWKHGLRELEVELVDGETCLGVIDGGPDEHGIGLLMLTQARLLVWQTPSGVSELFLHDIQSVHADSEPGRDVLVVHHRGMGPIVFRLGDIRAMDIAPMPRAYVQFISGLNELARAAVPPEQPPPPQPVSLTQVLPEEQYSAADEIAKLAVLKQEGLITEEEYEQGKRQALER